MPTVEDVITSLGEGRQSAASADLAIDSLMRAFVETVRDLDRLGPPIIVVRFSNLPTRGDEPIKPTAPASEANPAVPAAGHSVHGEAFNDGTTTCRVSDARHGQGPFPGHQQASPMPRPTSIRESRSSIRSITSNRSDRSARPPGSTPTARMAYWGMAMSNINNAKRAAGLSQGSRKRARRAAPARIALSRRPGIVLQGRRQRQGQAAGLAAGTRDDRPGIPRATSTLAPGWPW